MKILLICAGGYSTSVLTKKVKTYAQTNGLDIEIDAIGAGEAGRVAKNYDVVLVAPQIKYQKDDIAKATGLPTVSIPPMDYGAGKPERIIELATKGMKGE